MKAYKIIKTAEEILDGANCKSTINYDEDSDYSFYYRREDVIKAIQQALNLVNVSNNEAKFICRHHSKRTNCMDYKNNKRACLKCPHFVEFEQR